MSHHPDRRMPAGRGVLCWLIAFLVCSGTARAQNTELTKVASDPNHQIGTLPTFFGKDSIIGSPYLVPGWLRGILYLTNQKQLPQAGQGMFFNYDKLNERLFATDGKSKTWVIGNDSISRFTLADSNTLYSFEKIPKLSHSHLFQELVHSENGYCVYRRIITKLIRADYRNEGYYTTGRPSDAYIDNYEYLIFYRGSLIFRKPSLTLQAIKKSLRSESARLEKFFSQKSGSVDEHTFVLLMEFLNQ